MGIVDGFFDGSDAHRIGEDAMREQFEAWIKRGAPWACFDLGEGGDYIVLCMQDRFEAFCAGAILMGSNVQGDRRCAALSRSVQRPKGARSTAGLGLTKQALEEISANSIFVLQAAA